MSEGEGGREGVHGLIPAKKDQDLYSKLVKSSSKSSKGKATVISLYYYYKVYRSEGCTRS